MPLISDIYRELNRQLHAENETFGNDNFGWTKYALEIQQNNSYASVLDYGCGKGKLKQRFTDAGLGELVREYDPAIAGKDALPEPADFVVCTDVLEHIEPANINAVLRHLRELTQRRIFMTIYTAPASKTLADGRNAHLIVKPSTWWREKLLDLFQVMFWEERGPVIAAEMVVKKHTGRVKPQSRRIPSPQLLADMQRMRTDINAASDLFSQINTLRMFEGIADEAADLHFAVEIIERLDDMATALNQLARLSLKGMFLIGRTSEFHSQWDWKRLLERNFRLSTFENHSGRVFALGSPGITVPGVVGVGAVGGDGRWENVKQSMARIRKRIEPAPAHDRTAVLACYGPSLTDTIGDLQELARDPNCDVITVSGSHDFVLKHDVMPRYHVECDPRPHKALNLDHSVTGVEYLVASCCHPDYFYRLGDHADVKLWHVADADHTVKLIAQEKENREHVISGGGSVGLRSIPLLYSLGYRRIYIFGMDCSFKVPDLPEEVKVRLDVELASGDRERMKAARLEEAAYVQQWAGKHAGKKQDVTHALCDGELFATSPILMTYAAGFFECIQKVTDMDLRLYGHGLLQAMVRYHAAQGAALNVAA